MLIAKHITYSLRLILLLGALLLPGPNYSRAWGAQASGAGVDEKLNWKPNRGDAGPAAYVGAAVCAECHAGKMKTQKTTDMALAAARPTDSRILQKHATLNVEQAGYAYSITNQGGRIIFSIHDAQGRIEEPIVLNIGAGTVHESYLVSYHGKYYQPPVSYYSGAGKLVFTGSTGQSPASLEAALGAPLTDERVRQCIGCHATAGIFGQRADLDRLIPGIQCEACHGPGAAHVAAMRAGKLQDTMIIAPERFNSAQEVAFCGTCHHGVPEVIRGELRGIRTVMSQPYRLIHSRCWNSADARSRCTFCHEPHQPLEPNSSAYDAKCLSCHLAAAGARLEAKHPGAACPVGRRDCAGCHMPRVAANSLSSYTDHRIRIVRAGQAYPE